MAPCRLTEQSVGVCVWVDAVESGNRFYGPTVSQFQVVAFENPDSFVLGKSQIVASFRPLLLGMMSFARLVDLAIN